MIRIFNDNDTETLSHYLEFSSVSGVRSYTIVKELCSRLKKFFDLDLGLVFPVLGHDDLLGLLLFENLLVGHPLQIASELRKGFPSGYRRHQIDLSSINDIDLGPRAWIELIFPAALDDSSLVETISALAFDFISRAIQRQRAAVRREIIIIKLTANDPGTFCHKVANELIPEWIQCEACSIFLLDKFTGELRLRGSTGLLRARALRDVIFPLDASSWVVRTYNERSPRAEFSGAGQLIRGATAEALPAIYSRLYWPIQLQFQTPQSRSRRPRSDSLGVLRVLNRKWDSSTHIPFTVFDAFMIGFIAEAIFMMIDSFVDREVEGFDRDIAFHAAATIADGAMKNIDLCRSLLFGSTGPPFPMDHQFIVTPVEGSRFEPSILRRALDNAYSCTFDLSSQIERSNLTSGPSRHKREAVTQRLLADVLQKAINRIGDQLAAHGMESKFDINQIFQQQQYPPPVVGSSGDLVSVFKNIFENSVKYKKAGSRLKLHIDWAVDDEFVVIEVRDWGISVESDYINNIFLRGYRTPKAREYNVRGSGLGLSYCRDLLQAYGGEIWAMPRPDGLSVFVKLRRVSDQTTSQVLA